MQRQGSSLSDAAAAHARRRQRGLQGGCSMSANGMAAMAAVAVAVAAQLRRPESAQVEGRGVEAWWAIGG